MLSKINRYREIFATLSKYGLADWISRLDLEFAHGIADRRIGKKLSRFSTAERIRMVIAELGPTFIKLGQILSTRPDLIPPDVAKELQELQSNVPSDSPEAVRQTIEGEFGKPVEELFANFDLEAMASASIGQVHLATLHSGEKVVVKVQHAGIEEKIMLDLEILLDLAELLEKYVEESRNYRPRQTSEEFKKLLLRELDFLREKRNLDQFTTNFAGDTTVHIPRVFSDYCTSRVLTMERLEGIPLSKKDKLIEAEYDLAHLAEVGAHLFLKMIFDHGFYHADPHPGNVFAMEGGQIGLIDCGMVGRLDDDLREDIEDLLMSIVQNNGRKLVKIITRLGSTPRNLDHRTLQNDVKEFTDFYSSIPLKDLDLKRALEEMVDIVRRHNIVLPSSISLLIKVLVMLEGTSRSLSAEFDIVSLIKPYKGKMIARRLSPARQKRVMENFMMDLERIMRVLPMGLVDIVQKLQEGDLKVRFEHKRLEANINRLVLGMIVSALFLGSSVLLAFDGKPLLNGVSAPGVVGYVISLFIGVHLLWKMYRSRKIY